MKKTQTVQQVMDERGVEIYNRFLESLKYRADRQAEYFGISPSYYKAILARQKKLNGFVKEKK